MTRRRYAPITDVEDRRYPQLGWILDNSDPYGRGPLHIADKSCRQAKDLKSLTRCGRAIDFDAHINNGINKIREIDTFRLCARCGTREEFDVALDANRIGNEQDVQEWRKRRAEEEARRELDGQERCARAARLKELLGVNFVEGREYVLAFEFEGYRYGIIEREKIDAAHS